MRTSVLLLCLLAPAAAVLAQETPPNPPVTPQVNPMIAFNKVAYTHLKAWLLRSAEKMPEDAFSFKPADTVRNYGQIIGHVADAQYLFCSAVRGEKNPEPKVEETKTSKSDLVASLKTAFVYCDSSYDGMTDGSATQTVQMFKTDMAKVAVLNANVMHCVEHYGNLVTYMRLKGIVPPSTEERQQAQPKK